MANEWVKTPQPSSGKLYIPIEFPVCSWNTAVLKIFPHLLWINQVRYINVLTCLRGFQNKVLYLVLFSLYPIKFLLRIVRRRRLKKIAILPRKPRTMLEYWYIEHDLYILFQNGRHFSILLFSCKLALVTSFLNSKFKRIFSLKEATRANLQVNKRILKLRPFWNKKYFIVM